MPLISKRQLAGTVVSAKMLKTIVVRVDRMKQHPKYKKHFIVSRKYKAHDPYGNFQIGDKVVIEETRPISKEKNWRVLPKTAPAAARDIKAAEAKSGAK